MLVAQPRGLHRIGLRYIDRAKIPGESVDLDQYLNFRPFVGPGLPQLFHGFILGIQTPYDEERDMLRLQLTTIEAKAAGASTLLLDMDYYLRPQPQASCSMRPSTGWNVPTQESKACSRTV